MPSFLYLLSIFVAFLTVSIEGADPLVDLIGKGLQTPVSDAKKAPFNSVGQILSLSTTVPSGFSPAKLWPARCSGTVISPIHILTAAHCITEKNRNADYKAISKDYQYRFYPGLNEDVYNGKDQGIEAFSDGGWIFENKAYHDVKRIEKCSQYKEWKYAEHFTVEKDDWKNRGYTVSAKLLDQYDYAIMTLEKPVDEKLILRLKYDDGLKVGDIIYTAGYPGDKNPKYHMYRNKFWIEYFLEPQKHAPGQTDTVTGDKAKTAPIIGDISYEAAGGQSGSMIYRDVRVLGQKEDYTEIVAILVSDIGGATLGVRLTNDVIKEICDMMKKDDDVNWKKQKGCPGGNTAHVSDINILEEEYNELLSDINDEQIKKQKTLRLLNKEKRKKYRQHQHHQHHQHHHF